MKKTKPIHIVSFLGTTPYTPCRYVRKTEEGAVWESAPVKYVQTAVCQYWREHGKRAIRAFFFCTDDAQENHWAKTRPVSETDSPEDKKLKARTLPQELVDHGFRAGTEFQCVPVKEPFTEEGVWDIFNKISRAIPDQAEIVFDITHSFRSLPMVMSILLNYLKVTKRVRLLDCSYGAFEQLLQTKNGRKQRPADLETAIPVPSDRKAPLVSLAKMFLLNDWTQAVHDFEDLGNGRHLRELANNDLNPRKRDAACNADAEEMGYLFALKSQVAFLCDFSENVMGNRLGNAENGKGIVNTRFQEFQRVPDRSRERNGYLNALVPLVEKIAGDLIAPDRLGLVTPPNGEEGAMNGVRAAFWAYGHGMFPQAITLLHESIVSFFGARFSEELMKGLKNDGKARDYMEAILNWGAKRESDTFGYAEKGDEGIARSIASEVEEAEGKGFWNFFAKITQLRNDINHAGTGDDARKTASMDDSFWNELLDFPGFRKLKSLLKRKLYT